MLLEDNAQIIIGIVLKRKEAMYENEKTYKYKVFSIRSYEEDIEYDTFISKENLDEFTANVGDIVFRLAYPTKVIVVNEETKGLLINNQYCIIRPYKYNSDLLGWFLKSKFADNQFQKVLIGSTIKTVPVSGLRKINIPKLDVEEQNKISGLIKNVEKEKKLYKKMIKEKEKICNIIVSNKINGGNI